MSAESRAFECELIRPNSLDWREEDIVAVYGRFGWCTEPPADGQRVWLSEVQDCPVAETFLAPPAHVEE